MFINSEDLYTTEQIRQLESFLIEENIRTEASLMQEAGGDAFTLLRETWPDAKKIAVFCGRGNNAGDGFVLAQRAAEAGQQVTIYHIDDLSNMRERPQIEAKAATQAGATLICLADKSLHISPEEIECDVVVDALLGTGVVGGVKEEYATAIQLINALEAPTLALDVPSGLDADSGRVHGACVEADVTITFLALKQGIFTHRALNFCGKVCCADLSVDQAHYRQLSPSAHLITWKDIRANLPKRRRDSHKGQYGHVLVIGGDYGMGGAVRMASEAAMRVGAGLVTVATRPEHVSVVNCSRPEIMCHQVSQPADLDPLIAAASVIVIGPGLGQGEWGRGLLASVMASSKPKVIDADSLNILSEKPERRDDWILTPHPGEAARLLGTKVDELQDDRYQSVTELQQCYGGVAVLKGAGTIIRGDDPIPVVCRFGNPGMASGGMGDILSGVIGGLLAQGLTIFAAAKVGVFVHAAAADRAVAAGGERGLLATDLLDQLRAVVNPADHQDPSNLND